MTDGSGLFVVDLLTPSEYSVLVTKEGYTSVLLEHVILPTRGRRSVEIRVHQVGASKATQNDPLRTAGTEADGSAVTYFAPGFFLPVPLTNRNAAAVTYLTPGIQVPQNPGDRQEVFNANGSRANTNYFTVDGIADTTPIAGDLSTPFGSVAVPNSSAASAVTASAFLLQPLDAFEDVTIQSMGLAPEFGRSPGAQVAMTTRSGTATMHGSAYDYIRDTTLNANDYFANLGGVARPASSQNRYGASFGGAIEPDQPRTFYFLWYEGLNADVPQTLFNIVPDATTRSTSIPALQPYLNAFPVANGPELTQGTAAYRGTYSGPLRSKSGGARLDRNFSPKLRAFLRYSYSSLNGDSRGTEETAANVLTRQGSFAETLTAGLFYLGANGKTTEVRANYSIDRSSSASSMDNFGGATALPDSLIFPTNIVGGSGTFNLSVIGATGYALNAFKKETDKRFDVEDGQSILLGNHEYKIGFDVRRIAATYYNLPYSSSFVFNGFDPSLNGSLLFGEAVNSILNTYTPRVYPTFLQLGTYAQDTWKAGNGLTITFGARYDINPAPRARSGRKPYSIDGNGFLTTNLPLYQTQWKNIAPRISAAYQIDRTSGKEFTVRGGFGTFYDTSYGSINSAFYSAPYDSSAILTNPAFPTTLSNQRAPALGTMPYGIINAADSSLTAPRVLQYNIVVERNFGRNQVLSISYVGSSTSGLTQNLSTPAFTSQYDLLNQITGVGTASYKAGQIEFRRRFSDTFQMQASYTLSHAVDTASNDVGLGGAFATVEGTENGDSNFDVRNLVKVSGSFRFPVVPLPIASTITKDWYLDFNGTYRSGIPYNILTLSSVTSASTNGCSTLNNTYCTVGVYSEVRPDQLQPSVILPLPGQPGGQAAYAPAFSVPTNFAQGSFSRNGIRGLGAAQTDLAIRRRIVLNDRFSVTISGEAFNVFNQHSLANPLPYVTGNLSSPDFGAFTQSLSSGFGGVTNYGLGSPRTLEFSLRVSF